MTWACDNCKRRYISASKRRPILFYSRIPMPLPIGALHSSKLHRVCSTKCREEIIEADTHILNQEVNE